MAAIRMLSRRSPAIATLCAVLSTAAGRQMGAQLGGTRCVSCGRFMAPLGPARPRGRLLRSAGNTRQRLGDRVREDEERGARGRAMSVRAAAAAWKEERSPYETLGVPRDVEEEEVKAAYRRMAKQFHPDVYNDSTGGLEEGETAESKFIRIQAAYELLIDPDQRKQYDMDHRINPMKASKAWMDWIVKKKKAFEQRGDVAASVWAEQQLREMTLKARRVARYKMDPEEERRILAKEKLASMKNFETTVNRHTLVLKKRDLNRKKADEEAKKLLVQQLLAAEGLELDDERY